MRILVLNSGSSSIKFSLFDTANQTDPHLLYDGELSGVGSKEAMLEIQGQDLSREPSAVKAETLQEAIRLVLDTVSGEQMPAVEAVGYRVVHPGPRLKEHQRITPEVLHDLEMATVFAPLHDPEAIEMIRAGMARFPKVAHYVCFDTVFHQTMPEEAITYPVPAVYRDQGVRRYGFHGLSCESIVRQMRAAGGALPKRMVIAHLGSGCSVTALLEGCSVDTTMGLTPTGGVVMGTRPGDLDPGLMLYLQRQQKGDEEQAASAVETIFNHSSGMVALSGMANDVKAVRKAAAEGNTQAALALKIFTRSVTKAIGGFCWLLGGLDAIVFAGGIGEHDALTRREVLGGLESLGVAMNFALNEQKQSGLRRISASDSNTEVFVVPAQEDLMIALHVDRMGTKK
jgi:acetate kinase